MKAPLIKAHLAVYREALSKSKDYYHAFIFGVLSRFQEQWDVEASEFADMFGQVFKNEISNTLWSADQYRPKEIMLLMIEQDKEFARFMFKDLFDEQKDFHGRVKRFQFHCDQLFAQVQKTKPKLSTHYHEDYTMISTYLALRYPEKYTLYDYKMFKGLLSRYGSTNVPTFDDIERYMKLMRSLLHNFILKDEALELEMKSYSARAKQPYMTSTLWLNHLYQQQL